jgi:mono/diheme cytochrome c family protein
MPGWATTFSDDKLADLLTYLRSSWGNTAAPIKADEIAATRAKYAASLSAPCSESQLNAMPAK